MLQSADIDAAVRRTIETGMVVLALALVGLLVIAYLAALLERTDRAPRAARLLGWVAPPAARRAASLLLAGQAALASAIAIPSLARPAHAAAATHATSTAVTPSADARDSSVSSWLRGQDGPADESGSASPASPAASATDPARAQPEGALTSGPPAERGTGGGVRSGLTYSPATGSVGRAPEAATRYVIRPGDSLWRIASRRLDPGASNREIDAAWRRIYEANRDAVGPNPNLIHPGSVLELPAPH